MPSGFKKCPVCNGSGNLSSHGCSACAGSGIVNASREIDVEAVRKSITGESVPTSRQSSMKGPVFLFAFVGFAVGAIGGASLAAGYGTEIILPAIGGGLGLIFGALIGILVFALKQSQE